VNGGEFLAHGIGGRHDLPIPFSAAVMGAVVVLLVAGPQDSPTAPQPGVLYVLMWVVMPLAWVLLGPIWRAISPLRTLYQLPARAARLNPTHGPLDPRNVSRQSTSLAQRAGLGRRSPIKPLICQNSRSG
jgi:hypothetical protein